MTKYGLTKDEISVLHNVFITISEIEEVIIFGSRSMQNNKKASDIDLALKGKNITQSILSHVHFTLEEDTPLPYFFDVIQYSNITNKELKEHIDKKGKVFYKKNNTL